MSKLRPDTYAETIFGKRYCNLCCKYENKTSYCNVLKRKIKNPQAPYCSWFMRLEGK